MPNAKKKIAPKTKVIFRRLTDYGSAEGFVIALFPTLPGTYDPSTCGSYMHLGQHGSASADLTLYSRPATPKEYAPLARELRAIGYKLDVRLRTGRADYQARKAAIRAVS